MQFDGNKSITGMRIGPENCRSMAAALSAPGPARFAYAGAYTVRTPGGRSPRADARPALGITSFKVEAGTGALRTIQVVPCTNPAHLTLNRAQTRLYALNETDDYGAQCGSGSIETYAIDAASGHLNPIGRQAVDAMPAHFSIDPVGRFVVVANYIGGTFQLLPIMPDGSVGAVVSELKQTGSGPHQRQQAPHPHMVLFDPAGGYAAVTDLGCDRVEILKIDGSRLNRVSAAVVAPGSGPRHLAFGNNGRILYVINELAATIVAFDFDPASGRLGRQIQSIGTVPSVFPPRKSTAALLIHPSGRFLYGSNRKFEDHPLADSIVAFRVDAATGELALIGHTTAGIDFARTMAFDPRGAWLYVLYQKGDSIVQFAIDAHSGALLPTGTVAQVMTPAGLIFLT